MAKMVSPDAISTILANPSPDSSSDLPEIIVQVVDLKPTGNRYMWVCFSFWVGLIDKELVYFIQIYSFIQKLLHMLLYRICLCRSEGSFFDLNRLNEFVSLLLSIRGMHLKWWIVHYTGLGFLTWLSWVSCVVFLCCRSLIIKGNLIVNISFAGFQPMMGKWRLRGFFNLVCHLKLYLGLYRTWVLFGLLITPSMISQLRMRSEYLYND